MTQDFWKVRANAMQTFSYHNRCSGKRQCYAVMDTLRCNKHLFPPVWGHPQTPALKSQALHQMFTEKLFRHLSCNLHRECLVLACEPDREVDR